MDEKHRILNFINKIYPFSQLLPFELDDVYEMIGAVQFNEGKVIQNYNS